MIHDNTFRIERCTDTCEGSAREHVSYIHAIPDHETLQLMLQHHLSASRNRQLQLRQLDLTPLRIHKAGLGFDPSLLES